MVVVDNGLFCNRSIRNLFTSCQQILLILLVDKVLKVLNIENSASHKNLIQYIIVCSSVASPTLLCKYLWFTDCDNNHYVER